MSIDGVIFDFSGNSYHYNKDYGLQVYTVTAIDAPVGGRVYRDLADLGVYNPIDGETGFEGWNVRLTTAGPDGVFGTADDVVESITQTDSDGVYFFDNVPDGDYRVLIGDNPGQPAGPNYPLVSGQTMYDIRRSGTGINDLDAGFDSSVTFASLVSFEAVQNEAGQIELLWETDLEISNLGFNVYRGVPTKRGGYSRGAKVNSSFIPSTAEDYGWSSYSFTDPLPVKDGERSRVYLLEDVNYSGLRALHEPIVWQDKIQKTNVEDWSLFH